MAVLDYAFLADYAVVADGKLTSVGASFTYLKVEELPSIASLHLAARVRVRTGEELVQVGVTVRPPDESYELNFEGALQTDGNQPPYRDDFRGILMAVALQVPISVSGLYEITMSLDGELARRLAFEVIS